MLAWAARGSAAASSAHRALQCRSKLGPALTSTRLLRFEVWPTKGAFQALACLARLMLAAPAAEPGPGRMSRARVASLEAPPFEWPARTLAPSRGGRVEDFLGRGATGTARPPRQMAPAADANQLVTGSGGSF